MSQVLVSLFTLLSILWFFTQTTPVQAGGVTVGPVQINIDSSYDSQHFDIGKVEVELWVKSTDGTTPMPNGQLENYYRWELTQSCSGSCLKKIGQEPIAGSPTGRTNISYKLATQETRGTFKQTEGRPSGEDYEDGKGTGQISYTWTPTGIVTSPTLNLVSPLTSPSDGKTIIRVSLDLGEGRKDPNYFVVISDTDEGMGVKASLRVLCKNPTDTNNPGCDIHQADDGIDQEGLSKPSLLNNRTLIFQTKALDLKNPQYFLVVIGRYFGKVPWAIPIQQDVVDDVKPLLHPEAIDTKDTSKKEITISLTKGATAKYNVYTPGSIYIDPRIPVIDCRPSQNECSTTFQLPEIGLAIGSYNLTVKDESGKVRGTAVLKVTGQPANRPGGSGSKPPSKPTCPPGQTCTTTSGGIACDASNKDGTELDPQTAAALFRASPEKAGIKTAIGCVPTDPQKLIQGLFRVGIGLGGAAALLLMIGGAFQFITSAGNPDAIKSASETFTQAIIGLLVIIFAVLLLQVIGVDILDIPGFGK